MTIFKLGEFCNLKDTAVSNKQFERTGGRITSSLHYISVMLEGPFNLKSIECRWHSVGTQLSS